MSSVSVSDADRAAIADAVVARLEGRSPRTGWVSRGP